MNPYLIGFINALIPGLGYVIVRKKVIFGWMLLAGTITYFIAGAAESIYAPDSPMTFLISTTVVAKVFEGTAILCYAIAFGYDAYREAKNT